MRKFKEYKLKNISDLIGGAESRTKFTVQFINFNDGIKGNHEIRTDRYSKSTGKCKTLSAYS